MARQRDISIDRDSILRAAFALLDDVGLDGITMRALAARLSVQAPALYWHVRDKADLTSMMALDIYARARSGQAECRDARAWLEHLGRGLAQVLRQHRDSARLLAVASPLARPEADAAREMAEPLCAFGFGASDALEAQAAVLSLTLGWAIYHENAAMAAYLSGMFDLEASFAKGLRLLVDGLAAEAVA
ncbi:MAG: TetR family transcriptional regulator [Novosphingobium sp.]